MQLQQDNFKKVIDYANFILENTKKAKDELNQQINANTILEGNVNQMKDQVVCMREDWKREQVLVRQLENDLVFKENLLQEATELKFAQKNQIESLNNDVIHLNAKIRELSNRSVKEDKLTRPSSDQLHVGSLRI